jgi:hypothetical protein
MGLLMKTETEIIHDAPDMPSYVRVQPRPPKYFVGVDLGQSVDPTAICVLAHRVRGSNTWSIHHRTGKPSLKVQQPENRYEVQYLQRLPLGLAYPLVVNEVLNLLARPPLNGPPADLVIDETGVGRAVGDIFEQQSFRKFTRLTITAGNEQTWAGKDRVHVAKGILISGVDAHLHRRELKFAPELKEAPAALNELQNFTRATSAAGRFTYSAREGQHDDLVLAVAIALWKALQPPPPVAQFGIWGQTGNGPGHY